MKTETIYITSIDALLELFNAQIDRSLPDPEKCEERLYMMPVLKRTVKTMRELCETEAMPEPISTARFSYDNFYKERICFGDRKMWVWRKVE